MAEANLKNWIRLFVHSAEGKGGAAGFRELEEALRMVRRIEAPEGLYDYVMRAVESLSKGSNEGEEETSARRFYPWIFGGAALGLFVAAFSALRILRRRGKGEGEKLAPIGTA
ncbi:MAG: hypothetical protein PHO53_02360 [Actinomycetota bacterium]|nr:hypothetical protein [Actinomycetota bacterium]